MAPTRSRRAYELEVLETESSVQKPARARVRDWELGTRLPN